MAFDLWLCVWFMHKPKFIGMLGPWMPIGL